MIAECFDVKKGLSYSNSKPGMHLSCWFHPPNLTLTKGVPGSHAEAKILKHVLSLGMSGDLGFVPM